MSSLAGGQGSPNIAAYAATKAFNAILAEGLWKELKPRGVDVLACLAGAILTPGYREAEGGRPAPGTLDAADVALRRSAVAVSWLSLRAMITRFTPRRAIPSAKAAPRPYEPPATRTYGPYV